MKYSPHDIDLPDWGPYTKDYIGISHIADKEQGLRFDVSVFPGFYRRKLDVPSVQWESGYHPWEAAPDLNIFTFRHELEWKDRVYCDISYVALSDTARLIRCECVNHTDADQNLMLHAMASLNFPRVRPVRVQLPDNAIWVDALSYSEFRPAAVHPQDSLVPDGLRLGEVRDSGFTGGSALGRRFGDSAGDEVTYKFTLAEDVSNANLLFRYRVAEDEEAVLGLDGVLKKTLAFQGKGTIVMKVVPIGLLRAKDYTLTLTFRERAPIQLDGFAVVESKKLNQLRFDPLPADPVPVLQEEPDYNGLLIKYKALDRHYGMAWDFSPYEVREFNCDELDRFMRHSVHNHVQKVIGKQGRCHYTNFFLRPITLAPRSRTALFGLVCTGTEDGIRNQFAAFMEKKAMQEFNYQTACSALVQFNPSPSGEPFVASQQRMAATVLTNVVYPLYCKGRYIKHRTPGRFWDSLYTWDSGFIGLGLSEIDTAAATDNLLAYLTEPGDPQAAFIHHGSPVPVQAFLFQQLWNAAQSPELLREAYPRLQQYHNFLIGRQGSSSTWMNKSNMLKTWDYFYNSGGWDDYPPQVAVHAKGLEATVAPVINTALAIRTAKILYQAAGALQYDEDTAEYQRDIGLFTQALQDHAWDAESGYFGYVCHDADGNPTGILKDETGVNLNMGLDGTSPLVAGICTEAQRQAILSHLASEERLLTPIGLSTVDQSAPYYRVDGYWNGAVWMPHQWFIWKALLDCGELDLAADVAQKALSVWQKEVDLSYNCFEHFIVQSGRGAGWHHFSGLSSPVLNWFAAYYRPGRLTGGFDVWVRELEFADAFTGLTARLQVLPGQSDLTGLIVTLDPDREYTVSWNGEQFPFNRAAGGALQVLLPVQPEPGALQITCK